MQLRRQGVNPILAAQKKQVSGSIPTNFVVANVGKQADDKTWVLSFQRIFKSTALLETWYPQKIVCMAKPVVPRKRHCF